MSKRTPWPEPEVANARILKLYRADIEARRVSPISAIAAIRDMNLVDESGKSLDRCGRVAYALEWVTGSIHSGQPDWSCELLKMLRKSYPSMSKEQILREAKRVIEHLFDILPPMDPDMALKLIMEDAVVATDFPPQMTFRRGRGSASHD